MFNFSSTNYTYFKLDALYFILLVFFYNIILVPLFISCHYPRFENKKTSHYKCSTNINYSCDGFFFLLCVEFELWIPDGSVTYVYFFFLPFLCLLSAFTHPTDAHSLTLIHTYGWLILFGFFTVLVRSAVSFRWSAGGRARERLESI